MDAVQTIKNICKLPNLVIFIQISLSSYYEGRTRLKTRPFRCSVLEIIFFFFVYIWYGRGYDGM